MNLLAKLAVNKGQSLAKAKLNIKSKFNLVNTIIFGMMVYTISPLQVLANPINVKPTLTIMPEQCVALLQGQACYVTVELNWQTPVRGDYCLYSSLNTRAILCWQDKKMGDLKQEFVSKSNIEFFLRAQNSKENIANIEIKMAWVHKKKGRPRTSWRMF